MKVKLYLKIVCITLCINIISMFFSFEKKINAVGIAAPTVGFSSFPVAEQNLFWQFLDDFINALFYSPHSDSYEYEGETYPLVTQEDFENLESQARDAILGYVGRYEISDGSFEYFTDFTGREHELPCRIAEQAAVHVSQAGAVHGGDGKHRVSSDSYNNAVNSMLGDITGLGSAAALGAIVAVNGKPMHISSTYTPEYIQAFDDMGINYTLTSSVTDIHLYHRSGGLSSNVEVWQYYGFFIVSNGNVYILGNSVSGYASIVQYTWEGNWGTFCLNMDGVFSFNRVSNPSAPYLPSDSVQELKLCDVDGRLCVAGYQYYINNNKNSAYESQLIFGNPEPTLYPKLFEKPVFSVSPACQTSLINRQYNNNICFYNILDKSDVLSDTDILSNSYECCGYIESSQGSAWFTSTSGNLASAARVIGQHSTAVSGGLQTNTKDLTDIEKAIYTLAQQQGIGYEQMLEQSKIVFDEYKTYIEGLDGQIYSISSLLAEYDRLIEQGQLTADIAQANSEQIKAILEYLQGLDIEGLGSYIQQLESAINDLKQGDKDREAVLGDIARQLEELKTRLDSLGLDNVGSDIKSISDNLSKLLNTEISAELDISKTVDKFNTPDSITTKFPFSLPFDVYNMFNILSAEPVAPQFEIPLDFTTLGGEVYTIDIDLSEYDFIANIVRWLLYGVFLIGLILVTNRLIGRG